MAQRRKTEHSHERGISHEPLEPAGHGSKTRTGVLLSHLKRTFWDHKFHWFVVAAIIGLFLYLGHYLEHQEGLLGARYRMYRMVQNPWPRPLIYRDTVVVMIDDEAFWHDAAGRTPLKRDYLARLLKKIAEMNPAVICLDVNLASPDGGTTKSTTADGKIVLENGEYAEETAMLLKTINELADRCDIVLAKTLKRAAAPSHDEQHSAGGHHSAGKDGSHHSHRPRYARVADVYDEFGPAKDHVVLAYIFLYPDRRHIPPTLLLDDDSEIDSLALAAARLYRPQLVAAKEWTKPRFGSFIVRFPETEVSAHDLTQAAEPAPKELADKLKHKIVLIGGNWHESPDRSGSTVDRHLTPVGEIPGVVLHANYIEAILDDRAFEVLEIGRLLTIADIVLGLLLAYVLILNVNLWLKTTLAVIVIGVPLLVSFLVMQYLAVYWDALVMDGLLLAHVGIERILGHQGHSHG
jgi:CHASE2 domain-containing sensor protein